MCTPAYGYIRCRRHQCGRLLSANALLCCVWGGCGLWDAWMLHSSPPVFVIAVIPNDDLDSACGASVGECPLCPACGGP